MIDANHRTEGGLEAITPTDFNKTGALPREPTIFIGAKVMLQSNINVSLGLVNIAIGNITGITWPGFHRHQLNNTFSTYIEVDFDTIGTHRVEPIIKECDALRNSGTISRRMLPIVFS